MGHIYTKNLRSGLTGDLILSGYPGLGIGVMLAENKITDVVNKMMCVRCPAHGCAINILESRLQP